MTPEDAVRQPRQHPRRGRRARAEMLSLEARSLLNAEFEAMRAYMGDDRRPRSTAPSTPTAAPTRCATRSGRIRQRGRGGGARAAAPHVVLTDEQRRRRRASAMPMILAAGAVHTHLVRQRPAHLHLAQRALGRVPRRALFRGADRRRRDHGERLSGRGGDRRPPRARPVRQADARRVPRPATSKAIDEGLLKIMSKMGISVISSYRGGYNFEAVGLSPRAGRRVLPRHAVAHLRHRPCRRPAARRWMHHARGLRRGGASRCRSAASTASARGGETPRLRGAADPHAADRGRDRQLLRPIKQFSRGVRDLPPVHLRDLLDFNCRPSSRSPIDEVESDHRDPQALRDARHVAGRARRPRRTRR